MRASKPPAELLEATAYKADGPIFSRFSDPCWDYLKFKPYGYIYSFIRRTDSDVVGTGILNFLVDTLLIPI